MTVGERIKRLRLEKGMTQEELGKLLGITKGAVQKYESGQIVNFKTDSIKKLTEVFELPPAYFVFDVVPDYTADAIGMLEFHFGSWIVDFVTNINGLNEYGRQKLISYCEDLSLIDKYKRKDA